MKTVYTVVLYPLEDQHPFIYAFDDEWEAQAFLEWVQSNRKLDQDFLSRGEKLGVWQQDTYTLHDAKQSLITAIFDEKNAK